jgi:hypothetical protein
VIADFIRSRFNAAESRSIAFILNAFSEIIGNTILVQHGSDAVVLCSAGS